jgi:hypothetical protein
VELGLWGIFMQRSRLRVATEVVLYSGVGLCIGLVVGPVVGGLLVILLSIAAVLFLALEKRDGG